MMLVKQKRNLYFLMTIFLLLIMGELRSGYSIVDMLLMMIGLPVYSNGYYGFKYSSLFFIPFIFFLWQSYKFHKKIHIENTGRKFIIAFIIIIVLLPKILNVLQDQFYSLNKGINSIEYIHGESKVSIQNDNGKQIIHYKVKLKNHSNERVNFIIEADLNDRIKIFEEVEIDDTYCKSKLLKLNKNETYPFEIEKVVKVEDNNFGGVFGNPKIILSNESQRKIFVNR